MSPLISEEQAKEDSRDDERAGASGRYAGAGAYGGGVDAEPFDDAPILPGVATLGIPAGPASRGAAGDESQYDKDLAAALAASLADSGGGGMSDRSVPPTRSASPAFGYGDDDDDEGGDAGSTGALGDAASTPSSQTGSRSPDSPGAGGAHKPATLPFHAASVPLPSREYDDEEDEDDDLSAFQRGIGPGHKKKSKQHGGGGGKRAGATSTSQPAPRAAAVSASGAALEQSLKSALSGLASGTGRPLPLNLEGGLADGGGSSLGGDGRTRGRSSSVASDLGGKFAPAAAGPTAAVRREAVENLLALGLDGVGTAAAAEALLASCAWDVGAAVDKMFGALT